LRGRELRLLVRRVVHEHEVVALPVEELHLLLVDDRLLEPFVRFERAIEHGPGEQVAESGAHERVALPRLHVLEVDHLPEDAFVEITGRAAPSVSR
jgi:hypothetical protein